MNNKKINFEFIEKAINPQSSNEYSNQPKEKNSLRQQIRGFRDKIRKRYQLQDTTQLSNYKRRLKLLSTWLRYTYLSIFKELESEFKVFNELIEVQTCKYELEDISFCILLMAGETVEDKELFKSRLRTIFNRKLTAVKDNKCFNCHCGRA